MRKSYEKQNDLDLLALYLFKEDTVVSMEQVATTLTVFESIESSFISGEFTFVDNNKIMQSLDVKENCYLVCCFRTPVPVELKDNMGDFLPRRLTDTTSVVVMKVDGIKERTRSPKQNGEYVVLRLSSPSRFLDQTNVISRSIRGSGTTPIAELVEEFYYDRENSYRTGMPPLTDENIIQKYAQSGVGVYDDRYRLISLYNLAESDTEVRHAFPYSNPSRIIDTLCSDLTSSTNDPGYLFWETLTGFKLASMQSLFYSNPVMGYVKSLADTRNDEIVDERLASLYTIQSITAVNNNRRDIQTAHGAFNTELHEFDITTKRITKRNFNYDAENPYVDEKDRFPAVGGSKYVDEKSRPSIVSTFDVASFRFDKNRDEPDPNLYVDDEGEQSMSSQSIMFGDTSLNIVVAGNHMIEAGNTIQVTLPPTSPASDNQQVDEELSGTYVVRNLGHSFEFLTNTHKMSLDLARNYRTERTSIVNLDLRGES